MALSGVIKGSVSNQQSWAPNAMSFELRWSATQDVNANQSKITVASYWKTTKSGTTWASDQWAREVRLGCTGFDDVKTTIYPDCNPWPSNLEYKAQETTFEVAHNADGTKTVTLTAYADGTAGQWGPGPSYAEGTITLNTIPRASSVSASNGTIGQNISININRASSSFTHTIKINGSVIANKTSSTSLSWTIPNSYYSNIPNSTSGTAKVECLTYSGATHIGTKSTTFVYYINEVASKPTLSPTIIDVGQLSTELTGDSSKLIRYVSQPRAMVNSSAKNSASIVSNYIKNGSEEYYEGTHDFDSVSNGSFYFWTKDSRGLTAETRINKDLIPYVLLTTDIKVFINPALNEHGTNTATIEISGNVFNGDFGAKGNMFDVTYSYIDDKGNGSGELYPSVEPTLIGNTYKYNFQQEGFDYKKKYTFYATAKDSVRRVRNKVRVDNSPIANWGKDYFKFNVPFKMTLHDVFTNDEIYNLLNSNYKIMPRYSKMNICMQVQRSGLIFDGGIWFIEIEKTDDLYGLVFGKTYRIQSGFLAKGMSLINGVWNKPEEIVI